MKFKNPIIPGFYPDPSICRVGEDYYLATSSFQFFPGVPLFHSRDLVHWEKIGHCLTRKSQFTRKFTKYGFDIWAPTLRYHKGTFYMITTNYPPGNGNFFVKTNDPRGEWSDAIWVDEGMFDPSLFFDDDGCVYFTRRGPNKKHRYFETGSILQAKIDVTTGKLITGLKKITHETGGFCSTDVEGPHLYKIGKYYYLLTAEGGSRDGHMETTGRSLSPWGPFKSCPHNPILTMRNSASGIRTAGHADLIKDHRKKWWIVFLGTRHREYGYFSNIGRETFLAPVTWTCDGWPLVNNGEPILPEMRADLPPACKFPEKKHFFDFDDSKIDIDFNFLLFPDSACYSFEKRKSCLSLKCSAPNLNDRVSQSFLGIRQKEICASAGTCISFNPAAENEEAGLCLYMRENYHVDIGVVSRKGRKSIILRKRLGSINIADTEAVLSRHSKLVLEIAAGSGAYKFMYGYEKGKLTELGSLESKFISSEMADAWTGTYFAMYATGNGKSTNTYAHFDWFEHKVRLE